MKTILQLLAFATLLAIAAPQAKAHSKLSTLFKKTYGLRSVSCNTCHPKGQKKKDREAMTPFGERLTKLLKGKRVSGRIEELKDKSKEEKDQVWDDINKEFLAALKELDKQTAPSGKKFAEAIRAGEVEGTRVRKKKEE